MSRARRFRIGFVATYLALAAITWVQFTFTAHDGLANIPLLIVAAPYTLLGLGFMKLTGGDFPLIPTGLSYLGAHAAFFIPGVALTSVLLWWLGGLFDRH